MSFKETKFAYRHKPTGKWVQIQYHFDEDLWDSDKYPYVIKMELVENVCDASKYAARNIIEADLLHSTMNGERYAAQNFQEFELVEIEIEYKIKQ